MEAGFHEWLDVCAFRLSRFVNRIGISLCGVAQFGMFCGPVVRHFLRKNREEQGTGPCSSHGRGVLRRERDRFPTSHSRRLLRRAVDCTTGSRPHIVRGFSRRRRLHLRLPASHFRWLLRRAGDRLLLSQKQGVRRSNEMEFRPFPRRDVKLSQSASSISVTRTPKEWEVHASCLDRGSSKTFPFSAHHKVCSWLHLSQCC